MHAGKSADALLVFQEKRGGTLCGPEETCQALPDQSIQKRGFTVSMASSSAPQNRQL